MIKKLAKHGNSLAILIDKPILELLHINEDTQINVRTDGMNIILEPITGRSQVPTLTISEDKKLQNAYEKLKKQYDSTLKKLAE